MEKEFYEDTKELEKSLTIDDFISISMTEDKMGAYINTIPISKSLEINVDIIKQLLEKNNIRYGIDKSKIKEILANTDCSLSIKIASGKESVNGKDGYLIYHFDTEPSSKPRLLEDGSVDFRNLNIIQNVTKGQLLVEYIPPTDGEDGLFVTGEVKTANKGKNVILPKGKRVAVSEDGLQLLADTDGNVEIIDRKINVSNIMVINGNVDVATGNIFFNGDIMILGNVITGFTVTATGSINVDGFVEASTLKADGNIVLKNGIQGSGRGKLIAGGNIVTKFIEMADIYCKGNITTNAIMNSTIESESDIIVSGRRGFIVGGITKALNKIQATGLGNMSEITTVLEVGFTEESIKKIISLEMEIEALSDELKEIEVNMNSYKPTINKIDLMRAKIEKVAKYNASLREYERLNDLKTKVGVPRIDIEKTINIGTILFMMSDVFRIKTSLHSASFRMGNTNTIVKISYNKN